MLRKIFSNNIFRKKLQIPICKLDFTEKIVLLDSYFLGFFQPKFIPIFFKKLFSKLVKFFAKKHLLIVYFQKICVIQICKLNFCGNLYKNYFLRKKFKTHVFCAQINLAKKMANIVHKKNCKKYFRKYFFRKQIEGN